MSDEQIMEIAIEEAKVGLKTSNFPVGAVLLINGEIIDSSHNLNREFRSLYAHAENNLLIKYSSLIKRAARNNAFIEVFSTLEPCLYCFGGILQHNVNRLVYSVSDPNVGACSLLPQLSIWYQDKDINIVKNKVLTEKYLSILYEYNVINKRYDWDELLKCNK